MTARRETWPGPAVDRAAAENRATRRQRAVSALLAASILAPGFGLVFSVTWLVALIAVECLDTAMVRDRCRDPGARRWLALAYLLASTLVWAAVPIRLLARGDPTFTLVAIIVCCLQMMHGQSFAYRSRATLAVMVAPPALVLATVALGSDIPRPQLMVLVPALILAIGYVVAGALANAATAEALDASRLEIERLAYTDPSTGIANRRRFAEELGSRIDAARSVKTGFTLAIVDLDGLKAINDQHGHDAGDAVLAGLASQLAAAAAAGDLVARLGGDEFAWLIAPGEAKPLHGKSLHYRLNIGGRDMDVTASIGAAQFPADGETAEALFKAADVALYAAKRAARAA